MKKTVVRWSEMFPVQFHERLRKFPVLYLPLGLCEPHGRGAALGLDSLKAEGLCVAAAERFGGIVAPTQGYQIHESGYHARWLEEVIGEANPCMTSVPPRPLLYFFLYQLRAFQNAGFRLVVALTGHAGGNERDLRLAAEVFANETGLNVIVRADSELTDGVYRGDHAGKYELSQLLYFRPDLVNLLQVARDLELEEPHRFAAGRDGSEATADHGQQIAELSLQRLGQLLVEAEEALSRPLPRIDYETVERAWRALLERSDEWITTRPAPGQKRVSGGSQWSRYERV